MTKNLDIEGLRLIAANYDLFYIDQMNSHNKNFALYFKGREQSILARGENSNYINDFPNDLYIYDYETKCKNARIYFCTCSVRTLMCGVCVRMVTRRAHSLTC